MIDTNELRRLAQAAMHPVTKGRWMRLFGERTVYDRMEDGCRGIPVVSTPFSPPHPFEAACLDFIAAANPTAISELLDRLEAAEKERDSTMRLADSLALALNTSNHERDNLRAKIAEMEKMQDALRRHHENAMGAGLDPSHSLTKLRVSAYQQTCLYVDTVAALEELK